MTPAEHVRRHADTARVLDLFRAHPGQWLHWRRFFAIAPLAWRTRISDARKAVKDDGGVIDWNGNVKRSAYRLRVHALGRDASDFVNIAAPLPLFPDAHLSGWQE